MSFIEKSIELEKHLIQIEKEQKEKLSNRQHKKTQSIIDMKAIQLKIL